MLKVKMLLNKHGLHFFKYSDKYHPENLYYNTGTFWFSHIPLKHPISLVLKRNNPLLCDSKEHSHLKFKAVCFWEWYKPESLLNGLQEVIDLSVQSQQNPVSFLGAEGCGSVAVSSLVEPDALLMDGWLGTQLHRDYWAGRQWDTATLSERLN